MKEKLNNKFQILMDRLQEYPKVKITYFQPDEKKDGGAYITVSGTIKKINEYKRFITLTDGSTIPIDEIIDMDGEIFKIP